MGPDRGNAIGRVGGTGEGPALLLYGQLDTTFTNDRREDMPVLGDAARPDLEPRLTRRDDLVCGLGLSNPKGGNACAPSPAYGPFNQSSSSTSSTTLPRHWRPT